jgi:hypothetical protein
MKFKLLFFIGILLTASVLLSCRTRMTRAERTAYKMEKQMKKENKKMVDEYKEHHFNIQPNETQAMMKNSKKRAKQNNRRRGTSWVDRTFKRKKSKSCDGN